ncbi:MAG: GNAT family N-acetyltransferase [Mangrovicoccus sp.]|nr:GNAT family N-acetyltransferase [Mangrovicoccus sp.]
MHAIRPLEAFDRDWVLDRHVAQYCDGEGFDASFPPLVALRLDEVLVATDPGQACGWILWRDGVRQGSILHGRDPDGAARLRLFYLDPGARGQGLGLALLDRLTVHAATHGARTLRVATHAEHAAAGRLYARAGFRRTARIPVTSFGRALTEEHWEKAIPGA